MFTADEAKSGEVVISAEIYKLIKTWCIGKETASGKCFKVTKLTERPRLFKPMIPLILPGQEVTRSLYLLV